MINPLNALIADANMLSQSAIAGELDVRADVSKHSGGFRSVIEGVNNTLDSVIGPVNEVSRVLTAMESGDLTQHHHHPVSGPARALRVAANNTVAKLAHTVSEVVDAADQLSNASQQISGASQSMSQAASEQAASVEETSASIEQMAASISQNSENAKVTDGIAGKAAAEAGEGGERGPGDRRGDEGDRQQDRDHRRHRVPDQHARAERHDRGGPRRRARQGLRGSGHRGRQAGRTQPGRRAGDRRTGHRTAWPPPRRPARCWARSCPSIGKTSDLVQEIAAASAEQTAGVGQINTAMTQMSQITQQNASSSEELAATAEEMAAQTESLQQLMRFFTVDNKRSGGQAATHVARPAVPSAKLPLQGRDAEAAFELDATFDRF